MEPAEWSKRSEELRVAAESFLSLKKAKVREKQQSLKTLQSERLDLLATKGRKERIEKIYDVNDYKAFEGNDGVIYQANQLFPRENLWTLADIINDGDAHLILDEICEYSMGQRISRQESTLFGLALCARYCVCAVSEKKENERPITAAYRAYLNAMHLAALSLVNTVCLDSACLFQFIDFCDQVTEGTNKNHKSIIWEPAMKEAICRWYSSKSPEELAMAVTKCLKWGRLSHQLLFKLCEAKVSLPKFDPLQLVFEQIYEYIASGNLSTRKLRVDEEELEKWPFTREQLNLENESKALDLIEAFKWLNEDSVVNAICSYGLLYEHIPTEYLESSAVWEALIDGMPYAFFLDCLDKIAKVRNKRQKRNSLISKVCQKLSDKATINESKVNPVQVLLAIEGLIQSQLQHKNQLAEALERAFTHSFDTEALIGKRVCFVSDFSATMENDIDGFSTIRCSKAAAVMLMIGLKSGATVEVMGFEHRSFDGLNKCHFDRKSPMQLICQEFDTLQGCGRASCDMCNNFSNIDASAPFLWATKNAKKFDCFCFLTACTLSHSEKVYEALNEYRKNSGIDDVKLLTIALAPNAMGKDMWFEDPNDKGVLTVHGFDSDLPEIMVSFIKGNI